LDQIKFRSQNLEGLSRKLDQFALQLAALTNAEARQKKQKAFDDIQARLAQLEASSSTQNTQVSGLQDQLKALNAGMKDRDDQFEAMQKALDQLTIASNDRDTRVTELTQREELRWADYQQFLGRYNGFVTDFETHCGQCARVHAQHYHETTVRMDRMDGVIKEHFKQHGGLIEQHTTTLKYLTNEVAALDGILRKRLLVANPMRQRRGSSQPLLQHHMHPSSSSSVTHRSH
jgi:septal ring factor EnvC (AmiA/AmiB activator)